MHPSTLLLSAAAALLSAAPAIAMQVEVFSKADCTSSTSLGSYTIDGAMCIVTDQKYAAMKITNCEYTECTCEAYPMAECTGMTSPMLLSGLFTASDGDGNCFAPLTGWLAVMCTFTK